MMRSPQAENSSLLWALNRQYGINAIKNGQMKKILSFTLALTAIFLTSCKDPAPAENTEKGEGLTSFGFLKADNPSLTEDVACIINEDAHHHIKWIRYCARATACNAVCIGIVDYNGN